MIYCERREEGRYLIYDSESRIKASQLTPEALEALGGPNKVSLKLHEPTGLVLPLFKRIPVSQIGNTRDLPNWFQIMRQNPERAEEAIGKLEQMLTAVGVEYTDEDIREIVYTPLECMSPELLGGLDRELLEYVDGDLAVSRIIQSRILVDDVKYSHDNVTRSGISTNDAPIGLRLPDSDIIVSHVLGEPYQTTGYESTFNVYPNSPYKQYPNRLYKLRHIEPILATTNPTVRKQKVQEAIDYFETTFKKKLSAQEVRNITAFEAIPIEHVIGNADNDTVEIYSNEQPFYENLIDFIKYHIHKFNKEVMIADSEEAIQAKSDEDFRTGNLPVRLIEYLTQILDDVLRANFYHTGNFNYIVGDLDAKEDDDDDSIYEKGSDASEKDTMEIGVTKQNHTDADLDKRAAEYLLFSGKNHTASVWAEGIVKLMRWGDRKVRNLNVGVNNTQYLDLKTMALVTQDLADLSQFEVDADEQGRTLDALAVSFYDFKPEGSKRASSYPFIVYGKEYGFVPSDDEEYSVSYVTTLFDIVQSYLKQQPSVYYLAFDGEKFYRDGGDSKEIDVVYVELQHLIDNKPKIKVSDELMDYAIDNNVVLMQGNAYSLLNAEALEYYMSDEPLLERLAETPKPMRSNVIQGGLLKIFQEGASDYGAGSGEEDLVDLLNWYYKEVYPTHLEGYNKLFGFASAGTANPNINVVNLKASHLFMDAEQPQQAEEPQEERLEFMYPIYNGPELTYNKILRSPKDPTPIGACAILPDKSLVFAGLDEVTSFAIDGAPVNTASVIVKMLEVTLGADTSNGYVTPHQVKSPDSIFKIYRALAGK